LTAPNSTDTYSYERDQPEDITSARTRTAVATTIASKQSGDDPRRLCWPTCVADLLLADWGNAATSKTDEFPIVGWKTDVVWLATSRLVYDADAG
jgi:hypothetical protein